MKIAIIASGSRGDVEPYVALGQGLARAGHVVRLATHANFERLAAGRGLDFYPVAGDVQDVAQSADMRALIESGNFVKMLSKMAAAARDSAASLANASLDACRGADLVISGIGGVFVAADVAEKLGLPLVQAYYIPFTPTRAYPAFLAPNVPAFLNRASYGVARQMMWQAFRPADRAMRRDILNLPPGPRSGPFDAPCSRGMPVLYGYSPAVIPPPPDWGEHIHVTGYWFLDDERDWSPPPALDAFLRSGPPPVYVGFGSMSSRDPQATARVVLGALERAGQRGLVLGGWDGMAASHLPETVMMIEHAPFGWLFPRMAAVVHHGGAGTTGMGLRAGVPSVVVPFFGDQPYWGRTVARLGAGPQPLPRKKLSAERLGEAIREAVSDESIRQKAAALGARISAEDGVARAVEVISAIRL